MISTAILPLVWPQVRILHFLSSAEPDPIEGRGGLCTPAGGPGNLIIGRSETRPSGLSPPFPQGPDVRIIHAWNHGLEMLSSLADSLEMNPMRTRQDITCYCPSLHRRRTDE